MALLIVTAIIILAYVWSTYALEKEIKSFHLQPQAKWLIGLLVFLGTSFILFEPQKITLFPFICTLIVLAVVDFEHHSVRFVDLIVMSITLTPLILWASFIQLLMISSIMLVALITLKLSLKLIYKKEAFGAADIWVMIAILIGLGGKAALVAIYCSLILSALTGIAAVLFFRRSKQSALPFIPFLSIGTIISVFFSNHILNLYNAIFMI